MEKNFWGMLPRGICGSNESERHKLTDEGKITQINRARSAFQEYVKMRGTKLEGRKARDEKPFVSKFWFILKHRDFSLFSNPKDAVLSLLADSSTLFSRSYQAYKMYHEFHRDLRLQHGKSAEDELRYCRDRALRIVRNEAQKELYEFILDHLAQMAIREEWTLKTLENKLLLQAADSRIRIEKKLTGDSTQFDFKNVYDPSIYDFMRDRICAVLCEWFPDIELNSEQADLFIGVLREYFSGPIYIQMEAREAGHFIVPYRKIDWNNFKHYLERKEKLNNAFQRLHKLKSEEYESLFLEKLRIDTSLKGGCKDTQSLKSIIIATKEFFEIEVDISESVCFVVRDVDDYSTKARFPFIYLMVCVAGTRQLFTSARAVEESQILMACRRQSEKLNWKKRVNRIRFLHRLNLSRGLDLEERSRNWNLFLRVHGAKIESKAEFALWEAIISAKEDIPVIELTLLCSKYLHSCLPVEAETLYCYCSCSPLHLGGFSRFMDRHPEIMKVCRERVERKDWAKYKRKYLEEWSRLECDPTAIQELCRSRSDLIRWGRLNKELENFCRAEYQGNQVASDKIAERVQELKNLLVEISFREILRDEAAVILTQQAEKELSDGSDFKIFLTAKEFNIPEGGISP